MGHPVVGPSWEGFVLETLIVAAGPDVAPYFYRTADGAEIDLVIEQAGKPKVAIEVKRASAPQAERGFFVACDDLEIENRIIVGAGGDDYPAKGGVKVRTLLSAVNEVREILKSPFAAYVLLWNLRTVGRADIATFRTALSVGYVEYHFGQTAPALPREYAKQDASNFFEHL